MHAAVVEMNLDLPGTRIERFGAQVVAVFPAIQAEQVSHVRVTCRCCINGSSHRHDAGHLLNGEGGNRSGNKSSVYVAQLEGDRKSATSVENYGVVARD